MEIFIIYFKVNSLYFTYVKHHTLYRGNISWFMFLKEKKDSHKVQVKKLKFSFVKQKKFLFKRTEDIMPSQRRWVTQISAMPQIIRPRTDKLNKYIDVLVAFPPGSQINFRIWLTTPERMPKNMTIHVVFYRAVHLAEPNHHASSLPRTCKRMLMFLSETSGWVNLVPVQFSRHHMAGVSVFGRYRQNQLCLALHCTTHVQEAPPASAPVQSGQCVQLIKKVVWIFNSTGWQFFVTNAIFFLCHQDAYNK